MADEALAGWRLTELARRDLEDIWLFSAQRWSADRADDYVNGLFATFDLLTAHPRMALERREIDPPTRLHRYRSHLILYRTVSRYLQVVRVAHMRQQWQVLLGDQPP